MSNKKKIIEYIKEKGQVSAKEIIGYLEISPQMVFRHLSDLVSFGLIVKIGKAPKVFYSLPQDEEDDNQTEGQDPLVGLNETTKETIDSRYLFITPAGQRLEGLTGFVYWCGRQNLPVAKTAGEYIKTLEKYDAFRVDELISGMDKIKASLGRVHLDNLFYLDFYAIERFGKTKLGQLLLYAKQSQNIKLIKEVTKMIKKQILQIIKDKKIDGLGFVPPTVKRNIQFMKVLEEEINLPVRKVKIIKIKNEISVPQKTLSKLEERVENARLTFAVEDRSVYKNILLIDDAVGSGATLNEIAGKIKDKGLSDRVIGLALTGSFKGFDVISEV